MMLSDVSNSDQCSHAQINVTLPKSILIFRCIIRGFAVIVLNTASIFLSIFSKIFSLHCFDSYSCYVCVCTISFSQLEFSDDIVRIIQTAMNGDGGHPESRKANSMVKAFFIRVRSSRICGCCLHY